jgi:hypothetical protein
VESKGGSQVESKGGPGQSKGQQKGWGQMHHISQLNPKGADENYKNALFNCGPAVVAMLARGHGKMKDMTDAQLVTELGKGVVTDKGSTPEGIAQMMERADVPLAGDALGAGYTDKDVQDQLKQGHKLIAQVRSTNEKSLQDSAHYVVVEGMTREGNYVISDPLAKGPYVVKPDQLKEAVLKAPPDGGMLIPVAAPGEQTKSTAPTAGTNPTATVPGGTTAPAPAVAAPKDGFADPDLRAMEARRVTDPRGLRVADIMGPQAPVDPNSVAVAGRVSNPFGIPVAGLTERTSRGVQLPVSPELAVGADGSVSTGANPVDAGYDIPQMTFGRARGLVAQPAIEQPAVAQPPGTTPAAKTDTAATGTAPLIVDDKVATKLEVAEDQAFKVKDEELAKVDNSFTQTEAKPTDARLVQNEQKNDYKLDVSYSGGDTKKAEEVKKPVVDEKMSLGDFIRNLLGLKEKGSEKAYDTLEKLEKSKHAKDKKALEHFKKKDKGDHGAGSKRGYEDFGG